MPAFGTDPFQNILDYQPPPRSSAVAVGSQAGVSTFNAFILSVSVNSSKFLGFAALSPSNTAAAAAKVLGLAALSPSDTAAVSAKLLGYVVLQTLPFGWIRTELPPRGPLYPIDLRTCISSRAHLLPTPQIPPFLAGGALPPRGAPHPIDLRTFTSSRALLLPVAPVVASRPTLFINL